MLQWNNSKNLLFCRKTGFWSNIPFNTNPNPNLNLRAFLFVRPGHIYSRPLSTQVYYSNGQFICYAWPHRPSTTQADYSITALYLLCMATKALSYTGWLQHNGTFICYAWPQRPSATQADYSITALLFVMHDHTGWLQHNCTVKNDLKDVSFLSLRLSFRATDNLPSFPFWGTHYVLRNNAFRQIHRNNKLFMVCKQCWLHVRHISMACEPCGGWKCF